MQTWIALLRGINVGGRNRLPMKILATELGSIGLVNIRTYIQSGNIVFSSQDIEPNILTRKIGTLIKLKFGFEPKLKIISYRQLLRAVEANPFIELMNDTDGKNLHFFFLSQIPQGSYQDLIDPLCQQNEHWRLKEDVFYLVSPEGFGNSKLASKVERIFGVDATARNWRTIKALVDLGTDTHFEYDKNKV